MSSEFENTFKMYDLNILAYGALFLDKIFLKLRRQCIRLKRRDALIQRHYVVSYDMRLSDYKNYSGFLIVQGKNDLQKPFLMFSSSNLYCLSENVHE